MTAPATSTTHHIQPWQLEQSDGNMLDASIWAAQDHQREHENYVILARKFNDLYKLSQQQSDQAHEDHQVMADLRAELTQAKELIASLQRQLGAFPVIWVW